MDSNKNFADFTIDEFVSEPMFIKWVQHPEDSELRNFWEGWVNNHPAKRLDIKEAREIVTNVSKIYKGLAPGEVNNLWQRICRTIGLPETPANPIKPVKKESRKATKKISAWAVALFLIICTMLIINIFS